MDAPRKLENFKIAITMPSRGRADLALAVWKNILDTALSRKRVSLYIFIDEDDPMYLRYLDNFADKEPEVYLIVNNTGEAAYDRIPVRINVAAEKAMANGAEILVSFCDDNEVSAGWDIELDSVFGAIPDRLLCATFREREKEHVKEKSVVAATSKEMIKLLGFFMPPQFIHFYTDFFFYHICERAGRFWMSNRVFVKDLNPKWGFNRTGRVIDETHTRHRTRFIVNHDKEMFYRKESQQEILRLAGVLRGGIAAYEKAKTLVGKRPDMIIVDDLINPEP